METDDTTTIHFFQKAAALALYPDSSPARKVKIPSHAVRVAEVLFGVCAKNQGVGTFSSQICHEENEYVEYFTGYNLCLSIIKASG